MTRRTTTAFALVVLVVVWATIAMCAAPDDAGRPLRIAVIGDINSSYGTVGYSSHVTTAVGRIVDLRPDLVIGVGDLIAGQRHSPRLNRDQLEAMWDAFRNDVMNPLTAAGISFIPVAGNHDASADPAFALERTIFEEQWRRHRPDVDITNGEGYPFHFAFSVNNVLFIILDATRIGPISTPQRAWVTELLTAEGPKYSARVVAGHLPIRAFASGRENETLGDDELERVLENGGVGLYLSGHHHAFYLGYRAGFLQVSQACLGSGPRQLLGTTERSPRAITVVEIASKGAISVEALSGPDFISPIDRASLPESIRYGGIEVVRDDLAIGAKAGGQQK